jgi:hypothetical protein
MAKCLTPCTRFPDVDFFRDPAVQNQMTDVLFIYCKLNDDVSYRQGMHELLAPIFLVLNSENLDIGDGSLVGPAEYVQQPCIRYTQTRSNIGVL